MVSFSSYWDSLVDVPGGVRRIFSGGGVSGVHIFDSRFDAVLGWLGWCTCGRPFDAVLLLCDTLTNVDRGENLDRTPINYLMWYEPDRLGLTVHGSSLPGGFLTENGELFLRVVKPLAKEEASRFTPLPQD